jgi:hypothetical protein
MLDSLTAHKIITDNHLVVKVTSSWDVTIAPGTVKITVEPPW